MKSTKLAAVGCALALAALGLPPGAVASGGTTSIALQGGSLVFSPSPSAADFPTTTLTGLPQTVRANFPSWGVDDATGSGAGWHVTFQATQFTGAGTGHPTLPASSLTLTAPVATPVLGNLALPPVVQCVVSCVLDSGSAVSVVHALAGTGQGSWTMTQANLLGDLSVAVPGNATADTYTSTLTYTLATGP